MSGSRDAKEKRRTRKSFPKRIDVSGLGKAYEHAVLVLDGPGNGAVGASRQGAQVNLRSVDPQCGMRGLVSRHDAHAGDPGTVVDTAASSVGSSQRAQIDDDV